MQLWRLVKTPYGDSAFDGEGARLYGGRWNRRGTRVAYASSNSALAVLEVLVHLTGGGGSIPGYSLIAASLPDSLVEDLGPELLPSEWRVSPIPTSVQSIGDQWAVSKRSTGLRVPSVLVDGGFNILLNPLHADFSQLTIDSVTKFSFDHRLLR